jgi:hypothetical protein
MSSASVRAPTNIGIQKLLTSAKVNAVIESVAKAVIHETGFIVGDVRGFRSAEQTSEHDNNCCTNDGEANDRQPFADRLRVGDGDMLNRFSGVLVIAGIQRQKDSGRW